MSKINLLESKKISCEKIESIAIELLQSRKYESDSSETLLQAFRVLDTENLGFLPLDIMIQLMETEGKNPLQGKEVESFIAAAKDSETGDVYYEDYVALLSKLAQNNYGVAK